MDELVEGDEIVEMDETVESTTPVLQSSTMMLIIMVTNPAAASESKPNATHANAAATPPTRAFTSECVTPSTVAAMITAAVCCQSTPTKDSSEEKMRQAQASCIMGLLGNFLTSMSEPVRSSVPSTQPGKVDIRIDATSTSAIAVSLVDRISPWFLHTMLSKSFAEWQDTYNKPAYMNSRLKINRRSTTPNGSASDPRNKLKRALSVVQSQSRTSVRTQTPKYPTLPSINVPDEAASCKQAFTTELVETAATVGSNVNASRYTFSKEVALVHPPRRSAVSRANNKHMHDYQGLGLVHTIRCHT